MNEIFEGIDTRIKSPFFGYFLISALAINWDKLFYLLMDDGDVFLRIGHFQAGTDHLTLLLYPFLFACAYSIFYPWFNLALLFIARKPTDQKNYLQIQSEHKLLAKKTRTRRGQKQSVTGKRSRVNRASKTRCRFSRNRTTQKLENNFNSRSNNSERKGNELRGKPSTKLR